MDGSTAVAAETTAAHFDVFPWNHAGRITDKISRDKQSLASASKLRAARDSRDHPGAAHAAQAKERVSTVEGRW